MNALKKNLQVDWRNTSTRSLKYLPVLPHSVHHLALELQKLEELHENMLTRFLANFKQLLKLHNFDPLYYWWTCFFCNSVLSHDPQRNSPDLRGCFCKHNWHRHWIFPKGASLHYGFCGNNRDRPFSWGNLSKSWFDFISVKISIGNFHQDYFQGRWPDGTLAWIGSGSGIASFGENSFSSFRNL